MCGIVAYLGHRQAAEVLLAGLRRLEYRGYDSAGVAVVDANNNLQVRKKEGKVANCANLVEQNPCPGTVGIAHTRWATHGPPNDKNAHPHCNMANTLAIVHNGIIENEAALRQKLIGKGYEFKSDTDTEVLAHLVDEVMKTTNLPLTEAVPQALKSVVGSFGAVFLSSLEPNVLVAAKKGSPMMLGIGENEFFLGSDATPFVEYTKKVIALEDDEFVVINGSTFKILDMDEQPVHKTITELEWDLDQIEKGGYPYFMIKEIMEQHTSLSNCMRGRIVDLNQQPRIKLGGLKQDWNGKPVVGCMRKASRIIFVACGTSYHAALVGKEMIFRLTGIPCDVEVASEFRYSNPILHKSDVLIAVSQSGETADTLAAIKLAKQQGVLTLGVVNVVGSTISRETDAGVYLHAGPEIGVASTKAFTGQVIVLAMISLLLGQDNTITDADMHRYVHALVELPAQIKKMLDDENDSYNRIAKTYRYAKNFLFLGRGINFPVALEGALKVKEISYIHAEGYPAGEVKHGMIALVDAHMPVLFIARKDSYYEQTLKSIREVVARNGSVIVITDEDSDELNNICEYVLKVPKVEDLVSPLVTVIPMQALSYHIAVTRGCNVDKPRNLAKSVTVE